MGSQRFPGKILKPLPTGRMVLQEVLFRVGQIPGIDVIVAAIPDTPDNDEVPQYVVPPAIVFRGPEHDVLARYVKAAREVDADVIMRITADCPLIDPTVCHSVLSTYYRTGGFSTNNQPRTFPHGLDCEVFSREMLMEAGVKASGPYDREHVTPYLRRKYPISNVAMDGDDLSDKRWVLDTPEDYQNILELIAVRMGMAA